MPEELPTREHLVLPQDATDRFWRWSVDIYGDARFAAACIALQDQHGADVNIVLFLLWLAALGAAPCNAGLLARLEAAVAPWRASVIQPLRTLRRALKGVGEDQVRQHVAAAELASERSAQRRLVAACPDLVPAASTDQPRDVAARSLRLCCPDVPPSLFGPLLAALR